MTAKHNHKIAVVGFGPSDLLAELKPGWNPLTGKNGAGKSNVLAALLWALGGNVPVKLRHHTAEAYVDIDGVRIKTLGKPMLNIGDLELALRDESPIGDIILPDVKDPARGEAKRIESVLRQVNIEVDEEAISILLDEDEGAIDYLMENEPDIYQLPITAAADKARRRIHEIKRKWESRADEAQGRINAVRIEKPEQLTDVSVESAQNAYDAAVRIHDRRSGEWSQREEREAEREEIRRTLGVKPSVKDAEKRFRAAEDDHQELSETIMDLEKQLAQARQKAITAKLELENARRHVTQTTTDAAEWDKRKQILDSEITGGSEDAVEKALRDVQEAREALSVARSSAEYREACQLTEEATEERELSIKSATKYEKLATSVTSRLSLLLEKAGIDSLTVEDSRLMYLHKDTGELEPFTDLSFGQRTDAVIDLLARQKVPHDILVLPWQFYSALQPEAREDVGKRFEERGICAITEVPDDSEVLRVADPPELKAKPRSRKSTK